MEAWKNYKQVSPFAWHGLLVQGQTGSSLAQLQLWVHKFRAPGLQVPLVGWHGRREEALQPRKGAADVQRKQARLVQPLRSCSKLCPKVCSGPGIIAIILRSIEHIKDAPKCGCFRPAGNEAAPLLYCRTRQKGTVLGHLQGYRGFCLFTGKLKLRIAL